MQRPTTPDPSKPTMCSLGGAQSSPVAAAGSPTAPEQSRRAGGLRPPLWTQRLLLGIEVAISLWTGLLVLALPWTRLWTENPLLGALPALKLVLNFTFVRGMISGVGVVDIWMGLADALHYRDLR